MCWRNSKWRGKIQAVSQEETLRKWEEHFKSLHINHHENFAINTQLDNKLGESIKESLEAVLKKLKTEKLQAYTEYSLKFRRQKKIDYILLLCTAVYKENTIEKFIKGCILSFSKKGNLGIIKNCRSITLKARSASIFNALLVSRIRPEIKKILRKDQNCFRRNRSEKVR